MNFGDDTNIQTIIEGQQAGNSETVAVQVQRQFAGRISSPLGDISLFTKAFK